VILDGTLVPVCDLSWDPENYSGKHRRKGRSVQVLTDALGRVLHVGAPQPGRMHDSRAVRESGLLDLLEPAPGSPAQTGADRLQHIPLGLARRRFARQPRPRLVVTFGISCGPVDLPPEAVVRPRPGSGALLRAVTESAPPSAASGESISPTSYEDAGPSAPVLLGRRPHDGQLRVAGCHGGA
jgi:hypothetical protein